MLNITHLFSTVLLCAMLVGWTGCQSKESGSDAGDANTSDTNTSDTNTGEGDTGGTDTGGSDSDDTGGSTSTSPCLGVVDQADGCGGLLPSRSEGVAPLYVFFEPTFDTDREAFRTMVVHWNFGDESAGRWSTTNGDKNTHTGPIAAHVFERPGTFVTTATTVGPDGNEITQTATIVVTDPDEVFAGESTICVSQSGDFEGAPAGCRQIQADDVSTVSPYIQPGTRILFRRGETWPMPKVLAINVAGPGLIGAFGVGEDPIFKPTTTGIVFGDRSPLTANDWRIVDLQFAGEGTTSAIGVGVQTNDLLLHHLTIHDVHSAVSAGDSILSYWNDQGEGPHDLHDGVALSELDVRGIIGGSGGNGVYLVGKRVAFMGCHFEDSTAAEHVWRMPHIEKGLFIHNIVGKAALGKHLLKLHGPKFDDGLLGNGRYTEQIQISDNIFRAGVEAWPVAIGPQNEANDERLRDIVLERNQFIAGSSNAVMVVLWAQSVTVRNNLFEVSNSTGDVRCVGATRRGVEPAPVNVDIYNNTAYSNSDRTVTLLRIDGATLSSAQNNLVVSIGGNAEQGLVGSNFESNNVFSTATVFASDAPSSPKDFVPSIGSSADGGGVPIEGLMEDFFGTARSQSAPDVGAFENWVVSTIFRTFSNWRSSIS